VRAAAARAGIALPVSPHWFRHAHASHALDRGAPIHLVQATLGHTSITTTGRYLHARPQDSSSRFLPLYENSARISLAISLWSDNWRARVRTLLNRRARLCGATRYATSVVYCKSVLDFKAISCENPGVVSHRDFRLGRRVWLLSGRSNFTRSS
jgi:hypothetical protein